MKAIIDRIEKDYVVVEIDTGICVDIPKVLIPNAKEGDIIKIEIDKNATIERKKHIQKLMNKAFED